MKYFALIVSTEQEQQTDRNGCIEDMVKEYAVLRGLTRALHIRKPTTKRS